LGKGQDFKAGDAVRSSFLALVFGFFLFATASKAADSSSSFNDNAALSAATRFRVGDVASDVEIPPEVDYKTIWSKRLEEQLIARKILAEPNDPQAVTINARITHYEMGDAGNGWGGEAHQAKLTLIGTFLRGKEEIGTAEGHQAVAGGRFFSMIGWEYVYKKVAALIVFEAEKKMGTDR
jgi:hypothetical protein